MRREKPQKIEVSAMMRIQEEIEKRHEFSAKYDAFQGGEYDYLLPYPKMRSLRLKRSGHFVPYRVCNER